MNTGKIFKEAIILICKSSENFHFAKRWESKKNTIIKTTGKALGENHFTLNFYLFSHYEPLCDPPPTKFIIVSLVFLIMTLFYSSYDNIVFCCSYLYIHLSSPLDFTFIETRDFILSLYHQAQSQCLHVGYRHYRL